MAYLQVADGGNTLKTWRVAAYTLDKQLQTANKVRSSSLGVGWQDNNSLLKSSLLQNVTQNLNFDRFYGMSQATEDGYGIWKMEWLGGSLEIVASKLTKYKLDVVAVQ
jgi:hypothetical protein